MNEIKKIIEASLLTATENVSVTNLVNLFDGVHSAQTINEILAELASKYQDAGIELVNTSSGYRFRSRPEIQSYINKLTNYRQPRYSRATMETLAVIAYRQPVTRGEIENIRGVAINSNIIQTLFERGWIEVVGFKQLPGKPELLATTNKFLDDMGLMTLSELPNLDETLLAQDDNEYDLIQEHDNNKDKV